MAVQVDKVVLEPEWLCGSVSAAGCTDVIQLQDTITLFGVVGSQREMTKLLIQTLGHSNGRDQNLGAEPSTPHRF